MRNILLILALALTTGCYGQKKLSQISVGSLDTGSYVVGGHKISGISTDYLFTINSLATYIGAIGAGQNISNTSLRWNGEYSQHLSSHSVKFDSGSSFSFIDTNAIPEMQIDYSGVKVRHLVGLGSTPSAVTGNGAGNITATAVISGTDMSGNITVTTAGIPTTNATVATINFSGQYATPPRYVALSPCNTAAQSLSGVTQVVVPISSANIHSFIIQSGATALTTSTTYVWCYHVIQ